MGLALLLGSAAACGDDLRDLVSDDVTDDGAPGGDAADAGDPRPADQITTVDSMIETCGDGVLEVDAPVTREPYLQQVDATSAIIGWVTTVDLEQHIEVTTPGGARVMDVAAVVEDTIVAAADLRQRWATLEGLSPDTVYCYALASGDRALTARAGFRTAPAADAARTVRFVALGDSGTGGSDQRAVFEEMRKVPQDLVLHVGDIAYTSGTIGEFEARVFDVYAPLLRYMPMFAVAGNHEYVTDDAAPFRAVFSLPGNERWYSFDWGDVHFAALDTEQDFATQAAWLDEDLAATDRPWKIVFFHRPPYSSGEHGSNLDARATFGPVLERHGVQLVLTGHDHHYERTVPENGVTYIVTGGGGAGLRPVGESDFTAVAESVHHFVHVEIETDLLTLRAIDTSGAEVDKVVIPRE